MAGHDPKRSSDNFGSDAARLNKGQHYLFRITLELTESWDFTTQHGALVTVSTLRRIGENSNEKPTRKTPYDYFLSTK
jgi:hypothetical protein